MEFLVENMFTENKDEWIRNGCKKQCQNMVGIDGDCRFGGFKIVQLSWFDGLLFQVVSLAWCHYFAIESNSNISVKK